MDDGQSDSIRVDGQSSLANVSTGLQGEGPIATQIRSGLSSSGTVCRNSITIP
jgi:hypothetical protein